MSDFNHDVSVWRRTPPTDPQHPEQENDWHLDPEWDTLTPAHQYITEQAERGYDYKIVAVYEKMAPRSPEEILAELKEWYYVEGDGYHLPQCQERFDKILKGLF